MARLKAQIGDDVAQYDTETREVFSKDGRKKLGKLDNSGRLRGVSMLDPIKESDYEGAPVQVFTDDGRSLTVTRLTPDSSKTPVMVGNFAGLLDEATGNVYDPTTGRMMGRALGGKLEIIPSFPGDNRYVGKEVRRQVPPQPSSARAIVTQDTANASVGSVEDAAVSAPNTAPPVSDKTQTAPPAAPPSNPTKPKFNPARARKFSGAGGYEYAIDPETNVVVILKSPNNTSASPVYVRPDGKFPDAYKAIMAEYRASLVSPVPTKHEPTPVAPTTPSAPTSSPPDAAPPKKRKGGLISRVFNSSASDIDSDDI